LTAHRWWGEPPDPLEVDPAAAAVILAEDLAASIRGRTEVVDNMARVREAKLRALEERAAARRRPWTGPELARQAAALAAAREPYERAGVERDRLADWARVALEWAAKQSAELGPLLAAYDAAVGQARAAAARLDVSRRLPDCENVDRARAAELAAAKIDPTGVDPVWQSLSTVRASDVLVLVCALADTLRALAAGQPFYGAEAFRAGITALERRHETPLYCLPR